MKEQSEIDRWSDIGLIDENAEKLESVKTALVSLVAGGVATLPFSLVLGTISGFGATWEFETDGLALTLPLFGLVYRYAIRKDKNPQLRAGVMGAFAITRAVSLVDVDASCSSIPLHCESVFILFTSGMLLQGLSRLIESYIAYYGSALAIDSLVNSGLLRFLFLCCQSNLNILSSL
jgi:hypothetical protein